MIPTEPRSRIEIRPATRADLLEIIGIETDVFSQPWPYIAFEQFLGSQGFLVAEDEAVVGYIIADRSEGYGVPIGHIKDIAVPTERQGEGIGRTLLSHGLRRLATCGVRRVKLEVRRSNEPARSLYETFGFETHHVQPGYYDDGEDALVMVRDL